MKVLIVDDDLLTIKNIKYSFEQDNYEVESTDDSNEALKKIAANEYDIVILDLILPDTDGLEVCQKIREISGVPIMIVSANNEDMSKILGLEYGADDYITKPFNILELKARMKAILRRTRVTSQRANEQTLVVDDFTINALGRKVSLHKQEINLTAKEFDLLLLLITNPGKVFSREELLEIIWGYEYFGDLRTVDVHVRRLREKIETKNKSYKYILTKWGVGYYFRNRN
jgi:DNA-binding response OmpR family regulator